MNFALQPCCCHRTCADRSQVDGRGCTGWELPVRGGVAREVAARWIAAFAGVATMHACITRGDRCRPHVIRPGSALVHAAGFVIRGTTDAYGVRGQRGRTLPATSERGSTTMKPRCSPRPLAMVAGLTLATLLPAWAPAAAFRPHSTSASASASRRRESTRSCRRPTWRWNSQAPRTVRCAHSRTTHPGARWRRRPHHTDRPLPSHLPTVAPGSAWARRTRLECSL